MEPFDAASLEDADVIVDALFGTGFRGSIEGEAARVVEAVDRSDAAVVSVDIPSGVDGSTGRCPGPCISADVTVAMGAEKMGTAIGDGAARAGSVVVADIDEALRLLEDEHYCRYLEVCPVCAFLARFKG